MLRDEYLRRLVDEAHIEIYLSGNEGARIYWPWRMQPAHEASLTYRNACETFIVDSSFNREEITNKDVLDKAMAVNAEYAVLADVYQNKDATVDAIIEGLELYDDHPFDGDVIAPLQAPHDKCYLELEGQGVDYVAVGGYKDAGTKKQISATRSLRDVVSPGTKIHGLGFTLASKDGTPTEWVGAIQENPLLLDSIDNSKYIQDMIMQEHSIDKGEERRSVDCLHIAHQLVRDLRRVSSYTEMPTQGRQTRLVQ